MDRIKNAWRPLLVCLLLAAATLATFWPVLHHDFINFDDPLYVTLNPPVMGGLTWANVLSTFHTYCASNWHPLTLLSHMLDVQLYGTKAGWHHLTSLLLHTANTLLLFLLLQRLTNALWRSAFVAALFALHPLHVESVAWIAERKDVLSGFFFLLAVWAYAEYAKRTQPLCLNPVHNPGKGTDKGMDKVTDKGRGGQARGGPPSVVSGPWSVARRPCSWYLLALLFFALGLMSKPMVVTLPFVLLLLDYWPLNRFTVQAPGATRSALRLLLEKAPFFALSAASCAVTLFAQQKNESVSSFETLPLGNRLANAAVACLDYLKQSVWPAHLSVFYPLPRSLPAEKVAAASLLLVGVTIAVLVLGRRRRYAPVGWFWFLGMLVPVIGLVQVGMQARADRYTYLPLIGVMFALTWLVADLLAPSGSGALPSPGGASRAQSVTSEHARTRSQTKAAAPANGGTPAQATTSARSLTVVLTWLIALAILAALAVTTRQQVRYWRDSRTLFTHAVAVASDNYMGWQNLGIADLERNDPAAALTNFTRAFECARSYGAEGGYKYFIGASLQLLGRGLEALPYLEQAVVPPEKRAERAYRLGLSLIAANRLTEAETALKQALDAKPDVPEFQLALAALFQAKGQGDQADRILREVVASHPENAQAHRSLADSLMLLDRPAEAEVHYAAALKLEAPTARLRQAYATALARQDKTAEAIRQLEAALALEPNNLSANFDLAELLSQQGQTQAAIARYSKAIEVAPPADTSATSPVKPDTKLVSALNNLAWLLATDPDANVRNGPRAVGLAQRACQLTEWKSAFLIGTLAAAYAESGRFPDAVTMAEKARDTARAQKQDEVAKRNGELLELYRAGKPFHETR